MNGSLPCSAPLFLSLLHTRTFTQAVCRAHVAREKTSSHYCNSMITVCAPEVAAMAASAAAAALAVGRASANNQNSTSDLLVCGACDCCCSTASHTLTGSLLLQAGLLSSVLLCFLSHRAIHSLTHSLNQYLHCPLRPLTPCLLTRSLRPLVPQSIGKEGERVRAEQRYGACI